MGGPQRLVPGCEGGGASESGCAEQHHPKLAAQILPGRVAWCALGNQHGHDALVAESFEVVAIPQDLAQPEAELLFLVIVGDAFDFGDKDRSAASQARSKFGSRGNRERGSIPAPRKTLASSFCVSAWPLRPRSTIAGSTVNGCLPLGRGLTCASR